MIDEKKLIEELRMEYECADDLSDFTCGAKRGLVQAIYIIKHQPKVGEWIPIKENEPSCNGQYLMFVRIYNKYGSEDKYIVAYYYDGLFDVYPYIEVENCEVEVLAWQPLPEYPRPYSSGD